MHFSLWFLCPCLKLEQLWQFDWTRFFWRKTQKCVNSIHIFKKTKDCTRVSRFQLKEFHSNGSQSSLKVKASFLEDDIIFTSNGLIRRLSYFIVISTNHDIYYANINVELFEKTKNLAVLSKNLYKIFWGTFHCLSNK